MSDFLKKQLDKISKLPTIPVIAQEILRISSDDMSSVRALEKIVEKDPAIAAKILSVANSAAFGNRLPTKTINRAIMRIGFDNVRSIALGISLITVFGNDGKKGLLDYERIFQHSASVGVLARSLSREYKLGVSDELLASGMLHDIGFLVLNRYFNESYSEVLSRHQENDYLLETEKEVLGFTHADVGMWLAEKWELPDNILDATLHHHNPSHAKRNIENVAVTHLADYLTSVNGFASTKNEQEYSFDKSVLEILSISESDLREIESSAQNVIFI
jgi:putative nucleotidyltransferase with HDIG domain